MRIGILGGSFDPIHNGHLMVAQLAVEQLGLDSLHLVVAGAQPHKDRHHADAADRLRMVELAAAGLDRIEADGRELLRAGPSYTVDTVSALAAANPGSELVLLVGADAAVLDGWHRADDIRALVTVVSFRRGLSAPPDEVTETISVPMMELSSTAIRQRASRRKSLRGWVPDAVADYISRLGLYQGEGGAG